MNKKHIIELDETTYNMLRPIMKMQLQEEPAYAIKWLIHYYHLIEAILKQQRNAKLKSESGRKNNGSI